jgi:iron complex transport system permease protein
MHAKYNWFLAAVLVISIGAALLLGSTAVSFGDIVSGNREVWQLITTFRFPRIIVAVIGGAILGSGGLLLQIVLRNSLIDASILGIMNGTQFLTLGVLVLMPTTINGNVLVGAIAGVVLMLIWRVLMPADRPQLQLVLLGIATAMTFQALTTLASEGFSVTLPGLATVTWSQVVQLLILTLLGLIILVIAWPNLKYFALSRQQVRLLGVPENKTVLLILLVVGLWTGALTSLLGVIFFLGAVLPQASRLMAPRAKGLSLLPATALWGSILLLNADTAARTILAPTELSTSAVLLVISGPMFGLMLLKGGLKHGNL